MLLFLPLGGLRLPKFLRDFSVEAVNVSLLQASAELGQPLVHSFSVALPKCFLVAFVGEQGFFKLRQNVIRDSDRLQDLPETVGYHFLAKIGQVTFLSSQMNFLGSANE